MSCRIVSSSPKTHQNDDARECDRSRHGRRSRGTGDMSLKLSPNIEVAKNPYTKIKNCFICPPNLTTDLRHWLTALRQNTSATQSRTNYRSAGSHGHLRSAAHGLSHVFRTWITGFLCSVSGPSVWNSLPKSIKVIGHYSPSLLAVTIFKTLLKTLFI